jgi:hypothetical protein
MDQIRFCVLANYVCVCSGHHCHLLHHHLPCTLLVSASYLTA